MRADKPPIGRELRLGSIAGRSLRLLWSAMSLAVFVVLRLAAPVVRLALMALGLLSILIAFFYRLASSPPRSPFWLLLGFGLACALILVLYEQLLRLFAKGIRS